MRTSILNEIFNGVWMMEPSRAASYLPSISALLKYGFQTVDKKTLDANFSPIVTSFGSAVYQVSEYGQTAPPEAAPKGCIAVLPIIDALSKYDQSCGGPSGSKTKIDLINRIGNNPNIKVLIILSDCPGGEAYASIDLNNAVQNFEANYGKPVYGFIDDLAASGAVFTLTGCKKIVAKNASSLYGSIGTFTTIADYTEWYKNEGIRLIEVYADKSVDKNKEYYDALKGDIAGVKERINKLNEVFLSAVKKGRSAYLTDEKQWGTGKLFMAEEAMANGLIDDIGSFDNLINYIVVTHKL